MNDPICLEHKRVARAKNLLNKKPSLSDILWILFIVVLLVPQTRKPIMVAVGKVKVWAFSPSLERQENQIQMPAFDYQVKDLEGNVTAIGVGKDRVVFLSYWATWCPPCIAEMPSIQKLNENYGQQIDVVLITKENPKTVADFLKKQNLNLPVYNPAMKTPEGLNDRRLPTSYLIDGDGKILIKETGASDWNSQKVHQLLDQLLSAPIAQKH